VTVSGEQYDLIVCGLGAMGSAAFYHASRRGLRVLGIDRFDPPHTFGSSHAESRITRLAVGEGEQYLPFVARSHEIWRDLERQTGEELLHQPGGYIITPPSPTADDRWGGFVPRTAAVAASAGIDFELRSPEQVAAHTPQIRLQGDEAIGFEPTGGIVMCERAIATQLRLARSAGGETLVNTVVDAVAAKDGGVVVTASGRQHYAAGAIVATGAWFGELALPVDADGVTVTRQVVHWFEVDEPASFSADRFPFVMWPGETIAEYSAIFPMASGGRPGLKILGEQFQESTTAATVDRGVSETEIDDFYERLVVPRVRGVRRSTVHNEVCLYTNTEDDHFLIDFHPQSDSILFASPCSGHGFKHSTALGEAMVDAVTGADDGLHLGAFVRG